MKLLENKKLNLPLLVFAVIFIFLLIAVLLVQAEKRKLPQPFDKKYTKLGCPTGKSDYWKKDKKTYYVIVNPSNTDFENLKEINDIGKDFQIKKNPGSDLCSDFAQNKDDLYYRGYKLEGIKATNSEIIQYQNETEEAAFSNFVYSENNIFQISILESTVVQFKKVPLEKVEKQKISVDSTGTLNYEGKRYVCSSVNHVEKCEWK